MAFARLSKRKWTLVGLVILLATGLTGCDIIMGFLGQGGPVAIIDGPSDGYVGNQLSYSANMSTGNGSLSFSWKLLKPAGSTASLNATAGPTVRFTPDIPGSYTLELTIRDSKASATISFFVEVTQNPDFFGTPSGLAQTMSGNTLTLTWNAAQDVLGGYADSYQVYQGSSQFGSYFNVTGNEDPTDLSFTKVLNAGQTAWFKVRAVYGSDLSLFSEAISATAGGGTTLTIPTLSIGTTNNYSVPLSWNTPSGATGFRLYRAGSSGAAGTQIFTGTATSFTDSDPSLVPGQSYWYSISAQYGSQTSNQSAQQQATLTNNLVAPPVPTGLTVGTRTSSSISLSWYVSSGATKYVIFQNGVRGPEVLTPPPSGTVYYTVTPLSSATTFSFQVAAIGSTGLESVPSSSVQTSTLSGGITWNAPAIPTGLSVSQNPSNPGYSLILTWNASVGADSSTKYAVYRDTLSYGNYSSFVGEVAATSLTDTNLESPRTYYYRVKASKTGSDGGTPPNQITLWSDLSDYAFGTTAAVEQNLAPYPSQSPYPASGAQGLPLTVSLSWDYQGDPEGDPITYDLYIGAAGATMSRKLTGSTMTSWTPATGFLAYNTSYSWYLVIKDDHGNSTITQTWNFRTAAATTSLPNVSLWTTSSQSAFVAGQLVSFAAYAERSVSPYTNLSQSGYWVVYGPDGSQLPAAAVSTGYVAPNATLSFTPALAGDYYVYFFGVDGTVTASAYQYLSVVAADQGTVTVNLK
jgi:hypothetical protein